MKANSLSNNLLTMFVTFIFVTNMCFSQEIVSVKNAKGVSYIDGDISKNQARQNAINEAKIEALKKAGIGEFISSYETLFKSQVNNDFTQFFHSDIQSEMQGNIKSYFIKIDTVFYNKDVKQLEYNVIIDADVIKYNTKADPSFDAKIEGVKGAYNNQDKLTFSIKTTSDCYLTIFNITDHDASVMYPNAIEKNQFFLKDTLYKFPIASEQLDYELDAQKNKEANRLIFVITKQPIKYLDITGDAQLTETEKILTWIYSIMPDQRKVIYSQFEIVK